MPQCRVAARCGFHVEYGFNQKRGYLKKRSSHGCEREKRRERLCFEETDRNNYAMSPPEFPLPPNSSFFLLFPAISPLRPQLQHEQSLIAPDFNKGNISHSPERERAKAAISRFLATAAAGKSSWPTMTTRLLQVPSLAGIFGQAAMISQLILAHLCL